MRPTSPAFSLGNKSNKDSTSKLRMSLENRAASKYQGLRMKGDALKGVMDISFTSEEEESE